MSNQSSIPSSITENDYNASLIKLIDLANKAHTKLQHSFPPTLTTSHLRKQFRDELSNEDVLNGESNSTVTALLEETESILESVQSTLWSITRHVTLLTPTIEDGNNFGADVQSMVLKFVQERESLISGYMGDLATYFWQRGNCMEKIGGGKWRGEGGEIVIEEVVEQGVKGGGEEIKDEEKVGGEEEDIEEAKKGGKKRKVNNEGEDGEKKPKLSNSKTSTTTTSTSTKTTKTTKTTSSTPTSVLPDYLSYLISLDVKWYLYLKDGLRQAADSCLMVKDMVEKNKEKIEKPKGGGENGQNAMSMF